MARPSDSAGMTAPIETATVAQITLTIWIVISH
jgi:hypothetical protein